jgi:hypothetical protein
MGGYFDLDPLAAVEAGRHSGPLVVTGNRPSILFCAATSGIEHCRHSFIDGNFVGERRFH